MLVNIDQAKADFSKFIDRALQGDEIIITSRDGKPLIRFVPHTEETHTRRGGQLKGLLRISEDFDAPLPEDVIADFEG